MRRSDELGFTLIELLIVVGIIAILAAISIPRYWAYLEKSRESATKASACQFRSAIAIYYGDRNGLWPTTLNATNWKSYAMSLYLDEIPDVEVTHQGVGQNPAGSGLSYLAADTVPTAPGQGWAYDRAFGHIYVNSNYRDTKDLSYTTY